MSQTLHFSPNGSTPPLSTTVLAMATAAVLLTLLYYWALPKPIPGIPYNKAAAKSLFGDIGPMVEHTKKTNRLYDWIVAQNVQLDSPIIQLFTRPFTRPWVVVTDFQETRDVLMRRGKEFDRSKFFGDISGGITPENHFLMKTNDEFRRHRKWVQGIMTPGFLHQVAAPHTYAVCMDLIRLWEQKARLAQAHPISAHGDMHRLALDAIWSIVFGADYENSTIHAQLELYSSINQVDVPKNPDAVAHLPEAAYRSVVNAVLTITGSAEVSLKSPVPRVAHWIWRQSRVAKNAFKVKDEFIRAEVEKSLKRLDDKKGEITKERDVDGVKCAIDDVLRREMALAQKEERAPLFNSRGIHDELLGLLIAAHDTTGTALSWALKYLSDHQDVQTKLRAELQAAHTTAYAEKRQPTVQEITGSVIHYRDAVVEESIRCSLTESAIIRTAMKDVNLLGYHIPKGTEVFFMGNGPSIFTPAFEIDDSRRNPTYFSTNDRIGSWKATGMADFHPERWLVDDGRGNKVFDAAAGPLLTFGLGERGCYGRKLSYVEMKLIITLIVWNFEMLPCPKELSGYGAIDKMTHGPGQCYVRLVKVAS